MNADKEGKILFTILLIPIMMRVTNMVPEEWKLAVVFVGKGIKMIEVEVKLPIEDWAGIKRKLLMTGFRETAFMEERDTYFDNRQGDIKADGEALRVRETKDRITGKSRAQINFKGKKLDACTMTRVELETGVEDGAVCRNILQAIGYIPADPEVIKDRTMLRKESVTACLDNVRGLGIFLELEILADSEEKKEAALGQIEKILNGLGYQISDTVGVSYLSMLQSKW